MMIIEIEKEDDRKGLMEKLLKPCKYFFNNA